MNRMTAKDFDQELLELYDYYAHGKITKREFLDRAGKYAVGGLTAVALLNMLSPNYALAQQVQFTDPDIVPEYITYPSPNGHGEVRGYLVRPAAATAPCRRRRGGAREPRPQPLYRGCRAAGGQGRLHGAWPRTG